MSSTLYAPSEPVVQYIEKPLVQPVGWGDNALVIDMHAHNTSIAIKKLEGLFKRLYDAIGNNDAMLGVFRDFNNPTSENYITDDEIKQAAEGLISVDKERGTTIRYMMPRASWQRQDVNDALFAELWADAVNKVIWRLVDKYPDNFVGGIQLPQFPGDPKQSIAQSVAALKEWAKVPEMIGCLLNPNPGADGWHGPSLDMKEWYPLYTAMQEEGMPGLVHVSEDCSVYHYQDESGVPREVKPHQPSTWAAYMDSTNTAFFQLAASTVADDFPGLGIHFPHGLAAVLFQYNKVRGILKNKMGEKFREPIDTILRISLIDTIMYGQTDYNGLMRVGDLMGIIYRYAHATEQKGAAPGKDGDHYFDDVGLYHRHAQWGNDTDGKLRSFTEAGKESVRNGAAQSFYPRLPRAVQARAKRLALGR